MFNKIYLILICRQFSVLGFIPVTFGYNFQESSASFVLPPSLRDSANFSFDLSFFIRTRKSDGLVLFFGDLQSSFVSLELDQGHLGIRSKFCNMEDYRMTVSDIFDNGDQYFVQLERTDGKLKFVVRETSQFVEAVPSDCEFHANNLMFGGIIPSPPGRRRREIINVPGKDVTNFTDASKFKGTIQDARLNRVSLEFFPLSDPTLTDLPVLAVTSQSGLKENEITSEVCALIDPCENNSTCSDVFFDDYR